MEGTSICVLAMNKPGILKQTIETILQNVVEPYEIIVVDNGSTDSETISYLDDLSKDTIKLIRNETNLGLSTGTNQGLEAGVFDTLIHLDDDCLIHTKGWNQIMRDSFVNPKVGMCVPGTMGEAIHHEDYDELRWALGMCWAIRKDLFDEIGGYDPQLLHQNECDMALRVRMSGYHLAGIRSFTAIHNSPPVPANALADARLHIGVVQFRDKWCRYFRGPGWNYATQPLYLMQHWPPDQDFYRRYVLDSDVKLNPTFGEKLTETDVHQLWREIDILGGDQKVKVNGVDYFLYRELRTDCYHGVDNFDGYDYDRELAIDNWFDLTGERYENYKWPAEMLKPY